MGESYPIKIREATPADAQAIAELSARVFVETFVDEFAIPYPAEDLRPYLETSHGPGAFAPRIGNPEFGVWVALAGQTLAGYAVTGRVGLPHPEAGSGDVELYRLYVGRGHQGGGVAARLMETAMDWMTARAPVQWIGVWSGNHRAQRFYARYGFEKAGEYDYPVGRTIDREFILRRWRG